MINNEEEIFNEISKKLREKFNDIFVIGEEISSNQPKMPAVSIIQFDNVVNKRYSTFNKIENVSISTFNINIYSNDSIDKKKECVDISIIIDGIISQHGYVRTFNQPMANAENTIARRIMKYIKNNEI